MTKLNELNKKAAKFGFTICGSHERQNHYFLLTPLTNEFYRTPETTLDIIEDWIDELSRVGTDEFIAARRREVAAIEEMRAEFNKGETADENEIKAFDTFVVTRQDERQVSFILDDDKKIYWEITHAGESYLLVVKNPFEVIFDNGEGHEITYHNGHVVGVYYDRESAKDAAESMEQTGRVPCESISAVDYLEVEGKLENPQQARELQGVSALHYINHGEPIE